MKTGIFLDIFINDNVPDIYPLRVLHALFCYLCRKILYAEVGALTAESLWQRGMYRALSLIPASGVFHLLALVSKHLNSRRKSFVRAVTFPTHNRGFGAPRAWFEATTPMLFEGYELPVPIGYREYLVSKYGSDYLSPPPPEQRHRHPVSEFRLPPD
jgi:phosphorylcholine metabolism protein LicD